MVNRLLEWANSDRKREKSDLYHDGRNVSNEFCNLEKKREMTENEDEKKWADFEKRMKSATKSIHDIQDKAITGNYQNY